MNDSISLFILLLLTFAFPVCLIFKRTDAASFLLLLIWSVFYIPFQESTVFDIGDISVHYLDLISSFIVIYIAFVILYKRRFSVPNSVRWMCLFFAWGIVEIAMSIPLYGVAAFNSARSDLVPMLWYFFLLVTHQGKQDVKRYAFWVVMATLAMIVTHLVWFYFLGGNENIPLIYIGDPRSQWRFLNSSEVLLAAVTFIAILFLYFMNQLKSPKPIVVMMVMVFLLTIISTQHRSVWVATVIGLAMIGILLLRRNFLLTMFAITMTLAAITFFIGLSLNQLINQSVTQSVSNNLTFLSSVDDDATASWRITAWQQYMAEAMQSPIVGQGFGKPFIWYHNSQALEVSSHNGYIMYFYKMGLVGILLLLCALISWYRELMQFMRIERERFHYLLAYILQICMIMMLVYCAFYQAPAYIWLLLAASPILLENASARVNSTEKPTMVANYNYGQRFV